MNCCQCNKIRDQPTEETTIEIGVLKIPESLYLAIEVMNGRHGAGDERKASLSSKYEEVQKVVNLIAEFY